MDLIKRNKATTIMAVISVLIVLFLDDSKGKALVSIILLVGWGQFWFRLYVKSSSENYGQGNLFKRMGNNFAGINMKEDSKSLKLIKTIITVATLVFITISLVVSINNESTVGSVIVFVFGLVVFAFIASFFVFDDGTKMAKVNSNGQQVCVDCGTTDLTLGFAGHCYECAKQFTPKDQR